MSDEPELHLEKSAALTAIVEQPNVRPLAKVVQWLSRYGLAECGGIACALLGSFLVRRATGNAIAAAYAGAWGESIGYSAVVVTRDFVAARRTAHATKRQFGFRGAGGVVAELLTEFGPAGVLDTFVTRPFAMALGARMLGPQLGLIAGKFAADVVFYVPVIFMYERKKHWRRRERS